VRQIRSVAACGRRTPGCASAPFSVLSLKLKFTIHAVESGGSAGERQRKLSSPDRPIHLVEPGNPRKETMGRIRHLAIATQDPDKLRELFETAFGFTTLGAHDSERATGYMMSDGAINIGIFVFKTDQLRKGMDYVGLHHFGVQVDDADESVERVLSLGGEVFVDDMELTPLSDGRAKRPDKFRGFEGLVFDVADEPWPGTKDS